jgi:hypothetical protein
MIRQRDSFVLNGIVNMTKKINNYYIKCIAINV